jgi:hypothetical protein
MIDIEQIKRENRANFHPDVLKAYDNNEIGTKLACKLCKLPKEIQITFLQRAKDAFKLTKELAELTVLPRWLENNELCKELPVL